MYAITVVLLLAVLPAASVAAEMSLAHSPLGLVALSAKWFVFWAVGVRLLMAGIRQTLQPQFTAETIFQIKDKAALAIVQELGFANGATGLAGMLTLFEPAWVMPLAIIGGLYYGLAGVKHAMRAGRNSHENIAMVSDFFIFAVLAAVVGTTFLNR